MYRAARELKYTKVSSYPKNVTTRKIWSFQLGVKIGIDVVYYVIVGFMQIDQFGQQHQDIDTFYRPTVVIAQSL